MRTKIATTSAGNAITKAAGIANIKSSNRLLDEQPFSGTYLSAVSLVNVTF